MIKISQKEFGKYIKNRRKELGLTRDEIAEKLEVTADAVAKWEQGNRYPDFEMVACLAEALNTTVQDLYDNSIVPDDKNNVKKVIITSAILLLIIGLIGLAGIAIWRSNIISNINNPDTLIAENSTSDMSVIDDTEIGTIATSENIITPNGETLIESQPTENPTGPTQAIKEVGNYSLYHDGHIYYIEHSDYIENAPDTENANFIGVIANVNNTVWPNIELHATYFEIGSYVYDVDGIIYVFEKTHFYRLYKGF